MIVFPIASEKVLADMVIAFFVSFLFFPHRFIDISHVAIVRPLLGIEQNVAAFLM